MKTGKHSCIMKLNNLHLILSIALLAGSCVSEELLTPPPPWQGEAVSLTLKLKMSEVRTKAIGQADTPYRYATPEELNISECVIALFRLEETETETGTGWEPDGLINSVLVRSGSDLTSGPVSEQNDTLSYRIDKIPAVTGRVRVLVIANSQKDYSGLTTYNAFMEAIEETEFGADFDANTLVKVGYLDKELTVTNYTEEIVVPMVQLAARVDLNVIPLLPEQVIRAQYTGALQSALDEIGVKGTYMGQNSLTDYNVTGSGSGIDYTLTIITADPANEYIGKTFIDPYRNEEITITASHFTDYGFVRFTPAVPVEAESTATVSGWGFDNLTVTVDNIQTRTPIGLKEGNTESLAKVTWSKGYDVAVADTVGMTFYTYQKGLLPDDDEKRLKVTVKADVVSGTSQRSGSTSRVRSVTGLWIKSGDGSKWGAGTFVPVVIETDGRPEGGVRGEFTSAPDGEKFLGGSFTAWINPSEDTAGNNTDGLIHGNLYDVDLLFRDILQEPVLEYNTVGWGTAVKEIPAFE
jgi:hypothetical protein